MGVTGASPSSVGSGYSPSTTPIIVTSPSINSPSIGNSPSTTGI